MLEIANRKRDHKNKFYTTPSISISLSRCYFEYNSSETNDPHLLFSRTFGASTLVF